MIVESVVPAPLSAIEDSVVRDNLQPFLDDALGRVERLISPEDRERERARLVYNAVWLVTRCKVERDLIEQLIRRFFQP